MLCLLKPYSLTLCKLGQPFEIAKSATFPELKKNQEQRWNRIYTKGNPLPYFRLSPDELSSLYEKYPASIEDKEDLENGKKRNMVSIASKMKNVTEDGGIKKKLIRIGKGKPLVKSQLVKIHYSAYTFNNQGVLNLNPFDSTLTRQEQDLYDDSKSKKVNKNGGIPVCKRFKLHEGDVIPVLDIGVSTMEIGEKAEFIAKGNYAYGKFGIPDVVPSNATVFFEVYVVDANPVNANGIATRRRDRLINNE